MYCPTCRLDLRPMGEHDPPYAAVHRVDTKEHTHPITGRLLTIPMRALEHGRVYRIQSRNLITGVWRGSSQGFIGIREKFGSEYLFEEYHHETGAPFGTASAIYPLDITVPEAEQNEDSTALFDLLKEHDQPIIEEIRRLDEIARVESESRRWAPQTKAAFDRAQRIEEVRGKYRAAHAEADLIEDEDERKARRKEIHQEWVKALTAVTKGEQA